MPTAAEIIARLELRPHPEGGHYRETFRDQTTDANGRARSTLIYFLLARGERSHWHRIDAVESWHYYAGSPLTLRIAHDGCSQHEVRLGTDLLNGERPQAIVPADAWQTAETTGEWTLVGCTDRARLRVRQVRARAEGVGGVGHRRFGLRRQ
jgi:predicted cupin superfamily sugar epimerase